MSVAAKRIMTRDISCTEETCSRATAVTIICLILRARCERPEHSTSQPCFLHLVDYFRISLIQSIAALSKELFAQHVLKAATTRDYPVCRRQTVNGPE